MDRTKAPAPTSFSEQDWRSQQELYTPSHDEKIKVPSTHVGSHWRKHRKTAGHSSSSSSSSTSTTIPTKSVPKPKTATSTESKRPLESSRITKKDTTGSSTAAVSEAAVVIKPSISPKKTSFPPVKTEDREIQLITFNLTELDNLVSAVQDAERNRGCTRKQLDTLEKVLRRIDEAAENTKSRSVLDHIIRNHTVSRAAVGTELYKFKLRCQEKLKTL